ncbi:IS3 family transposase [Pectinatus brassicae]|uniref:IS3 family transposase n=1 Tax=Pectinatus brassicae TaxID=862415 RepID=UPI001E304E79|nr:IS3 family transposase [Pectinatus brassicae]
MEHTPKDQLLRDKILALHAAEHKDFGYRRIWGFLRQNGITVNKKRIQRIMSSFSYK